jgi:hypothetical protein
VPSDDESPSVIGGVVAHHLGLVAAAGGRVDDPDVGRAADDVVVREHGARRRQHHAGARRLGVLVGEVGLDDDDAASDPRGPATRGEGKADGARRGGDDDGHQGDAGTEAPARPGLGFWRRGIGIHGAASEGFKGVSLVLVFGHR